MSRKIGELIDQITEIEQLFHDIPPVGNAVIPTKDLIYDVEDFKIWLQSIRFELEKINEIKPDTLISDTIDITKKKFNGWKDRQIFSDLKAKLIVIRDNIDFIYGVEGSSQKIKSPKIFISHSTEDSEYAQKIIDLLEFMGLTENSVFCSSVEGYGIGLGDDIIETIHHQFYDYDLHIIFLLSKNYYSSCYSMNEMGAAWVLKNSYTLILLPQFDFKDMDGVVNRDKIGIKLDDDARKVRSGLNQLYKVIIEEFRLKRKNDDRWETKRDEFIKEIQNLSQE